MLSTIQKAARSWLYFVSFRLLRQSVLLLNTLNPSILPVSLMLVYECVCLPVRGWMLYIEVSEYQHW